MVLLSRNGEYLVYMVGLFLLLDVHVTDTAGH